MVRDPVVTSRIMSAVLSRGGKADRALGSALHRLGFRFRRKSNLPGKPDLVFSASRVAVFVDGDFWHGRYLEERIERGDFKRNAEYWIPKLTRNRERDAEVTAQLVRTGWTVVRIWESDVQRDLDSSVERVIQSLKVSRP